jgi:hypothetical protein
MTDVKRYEDEKRVHEVHSETTVRKSQQCEATADVMVLAREVGSQPSEKNLRILSIFDPLEKSSGNLQVFKRRTRGANGALDGIRNSEFGIRNSEFGIRNSEVGSRKSEVGSRKSEVGSRKSEVGSRKSEVGSRKSEVGSRNEKGKLQKWEVNGKFGIPNRKLVCGVREKVRRLFYYRSADNITGHVERVVTPLPACHSFREVCPYVNLFVGKGLVQTSSVGNKP